jgi:hypothetical protein
LYTRDRWTRSILVFVVAVCFGITGCGAAGLLTDRSDPPATVTANHLHAIFPELEALALTGWRDQDWCRYIVYARGAFVETTNPSTCSMAPPRSFDDQARRDFDRISSLIGGAGGGAYTLSITLDGAGAIQRAGFDLTCAQCESRGINFQPDHDVISDSDREERMTRIDKDWWMWEVNVRA